MKAGLTILMTWFAVSSFGQEDDPFSQPAQDVVHAERGIKSIPSSVTHERLDDGKHQYSISKIYNASQKRKAESAGIKKGKKVGKQRVAAPFAPIDDSGLDDYPESLYEGAVPDCDEFHIDFENRKCSFTTSRELTLSELANAIDEMAWVGGDIPYWIELEARDIRKSEQYNKNNYLIEAFEGVVPPNLAWFWVPKEHQISTLIGVGMIEQGELMFTPTTAHCMAHSRFAIRILDAHGRLLWHDDSTAIADVRFAVADIDRDGLHDILLDRNDHGQSARFLIKRNIEDAAEQPAASSESK